MKPHPLSTTSLICCAGLASLAFALASCESPHQTAAHSSARSSNNLAGRNTLAEVTIRTGADNVAIAGTTVDGRRLRSQGSTTQKAVANLEVAAGST